MQSDKRRCFTQGTEYTEQEANFWLLLSCLDVLHGISSGRNKLLQFTVEERIYVHWHTVMEVTSNGSLNSPFRTVTIGSRLALMSLQVTASTAIRAVFQLNPSAKVVKEPCAGSGCPALPDIRPTLRGFCLPQNIYLSIQQCQTAHQLVNFIES